MTSQTARRVTYIDNEGTRHVVSDTMSHDQAIAMRATLHRDAAAWGGVRQVYIDDTGRPLDTRTIAEIEAQIII